MYYIKATRCSQIAATANQAPDYLFHVLLLMSLVAAGEAEEVHSAPTPQPRRGKACSALTNCPHKLCQDNGAQGWQVPDPSSFNRELA